MSREAYQDRAAVTLSAAAAAPRWLTAPGLAWSLLMLSDPDLGAAHFAAIGFSHAPEAEFEVGGRRFGVGCPRGAGGLAAWGNSASAEYPSCRRWKRSGQAVDEEQPQDDRSWRDPRPASAHGSVGPTRRGLTPQAA
jgi:hypothetical protein